MTGDEEMACGRVILSFHSYIPKLAYILRCFSWANHLDSTSDSVGGILKISTVDRRISSLFLTFFFLRLNLISVMFFLLKITQG